MSKDRNTNPLFEMFARQWSPQGKYFALKAKARAEAQRTEVAFMCVSQAEGQLLSQLVSFHAQGKPQKWVEVGALTGFSALCLAEGLSKGSQIWTCELNSERVAFLKGLFAAPELQVQIQVIEGDSKVSMSSLESQGPFDGIFIDGAKSDYEVNLDWAERNLRKGGLILADNIFLGGDLFQEPSKRTEAMKRFIERLLNPAKFRSVLLPAHDGLWMAEKL